MNKLAKIITCATLSGSMLFAVACSGSCGGGQLDSEKRWLSLAITQPDQVFNPFFSTSLTDAKIISQTQASLITSDKINGTVEAVAGDNYPTVAKDYEIKYFDAKVGGNEVSDSAQAATNGRTEYSFLIKKGVKFSDGEPLTIKDVLFNFYVYLDPVYAGSNTMYSVDIQGLKAYRNNNSLLGDDATGNDALAAANAQVRMTELIEYGAGDRTELTEQGESDYKEVQRMFKEELTTDWNNMVTSWVDTYKVNYTFTEAWQAYLFQEGIISVQRKQYSDGTVKEIRFNPDTNTEISPDDKDAYANGKIKTTLDDWVEGAQGADPGHNYAVDAGIIDGINSCEGDQDKIRDWCINKVYDTNLGTKDGLDEVLSYWATATNAYNFFFSSELGKLLEGSIHPQYFISGIRAETTDTFKGQSLGDTYDVLKIIINGVDPAAIWQFGVSIAPLHYYSGVWDDFDYSDVNNFTGDKITDYSGAGDESIRFGVKRGDFEGFFQQVLRGDKKSGVPVGAGPYKASTEFGGTAGSKGDFFSKNFVYYERNDNFTTFGDGIDNARIKHMQYKVIDESRIITSVASGDIDYGEPNATSTNLAEIEHNKDIYGYTHYDTNGYGYVGVNPKFIPDVEVRKIIMSAMDVSLSKIYYGDLGNLLYRPMSTTSWAYPDNPVRMYAEWKPSEIETQLRSIGYSKGSDGIYANSEGDKLKYTFTIAGANTDHPAYNMFVQAEKKLDQAGFDITVSTDPNALLKLTSGGLAVWAAAWSSGVDPDMYQVYHKDSKATSTLNWGYDVIKDVNRSEYDDEREIVNTLSDKIMQARRTLERGTRKAIYAECLDLIMDLACELPVYQRRDLCVYNKNVLDAETLNLPGNETIGVIDRIWEVNYR